MDIKITLKNYRCFEDSHPAELRLHKGVAAVIGKNNAGKSALLRMFYELRPVFEQLRDGKFVDAIRTEQSFELRGGIDVRTIFCDLNERDITISLAARDLGEVEELKPIDIVIPRGRAAFRIEIPGFDSNASPRGIGSVDNIVQLGEHRINLDSVKTVAEALANCMYVGPYRNAINVSAPDGFYYDLYVGQNFVAQWHQMQTGNDPGQQLAAYRVTKDIQRVFELQELESRASNDNRQIRLLVDGRPYELQATGAGLSQFFVVLGNAALRRPTYILIDEPEINLHPALQMDFVSTLESYCVEGVLFATHSLGLARTVAQRTYAITKRRGEAARVSDLEAVPRLAEFVGALSFSNRPELGFSRILLVESRTDIRPMQHFLRMLGKDHEVMPLPLGGDTLINDHPDTEFQLNELTRITDAANIHAVIDSELQHTGDALASNRAAFLAMCKRVGIRCHVLRRRALENYFTDRAIATALGPGHARIGEFGKPDWNKNANGRIARNIKQSELEHTDLWQFLANV